MASDSRRQIIEQLKKLKLIHEKTVSSDTLSGSSLETLNAILDQVRKNGPKSEKAKQMVKKEAMSVGGKKAAKAVQIQLNDQQVAQRISDLGNIQVDLKSGQSSKEVDSLRKQIKGLIKACQQGNEQAIKLVKSLDTKKIKGLKDNASIVKQFGKQTKDAGVNLQKFAKTSKMLNKTPIDSIRKMSESFHDTKEEIEETTKYFQNFAKNIKNINLADLKKGLNLTNVSASAITAIKSIDSFHKKIQGVTDDIIKYHRNTQIMGSTNIDLMPGGAKQLDSIRRNMNLTRDETVQFAQTVSQLRTTTYSVDDLTKAMQGMKQTIGQVDPTKLQALATIMQSIPKDQLDAFTSGSGSEGDTMNAIMAMQKSGQTDKVLQLGASGAFGAQFAQAAGVKINQNQKSYINNKRAAKTMTQTVQNKAQQTLSNNSYIGKRLAATPLASALTPFQGVAKTLTSLIGAFGKGDSESTTQTKQNTQSNKQSKQQTYGFSETPQKKQQGVNTEQEKQKQLANKDQLLKNIDKKIGALLKKKFQISSVNKVKLVENVKSVGKIKQLQFTRKVRTVDLVKKVNDGIVQKDGKGGKQKDIITNAVKKLTQASKGGTNEKLGQRIDSTATSQLGQITSKLFDSALGQRKTDSKSNGSIVQDVSGLAKNIIGSKEQDSSGFDLESFFSGKLSDYFGNGKIQDIIKPQNISNLIKGKFDFKQLKNLQFLKDLKNLKELTNLKNLKNVANFKNLLKARHLKGGRAILKVAGAAHKGYKAYKSAKVAHGAVKAAMIGGKVALGGGMKAALAGTGVGIPAAVAMHIAQSAVGGAINAYQDNAAAKNIKEQMGIQQEDKGWIGTAEQVIDATNAMVNPLGLLSKNIMKTGDVSKGFNTTLDQMESAWQGFAQTITFGLYKENQKKKKQRQIDIAANTQDKYSVQGFKQIYRIKETVDDLRKENMKRNQYMAKQYAGFSKKLDLIKSGNYALQQQVKEQTALAKMENSFMMGSNNSDYGMQSANVVASSLDELGQNLNQLSQLKSSVMKDNDLTDTQRNIQLLQIQQQQIQARKKFIGNLKKALDCKNIPSIIQNSFKTMINNARIDSASAGYGGDDNAMLDAIGENMKNAIDDFFEASKFNLGSSKQIQQSNAKLISDALRSFESNIGNSVNNNAIMAQVLETSQSKEGKSNLISGNTGYDLTWKQLGYGNKLNAQQVETWIASGGVGGIDGSDIKQMRETGTTSNGQLNSSMLNSSKQNMAANLIKRFEQQRKSGDFQGAKVTFDAIKRLEKAVSEKGGNTKGLKDAISKMQNVVDTMQGVNAFASQTKRTGGVDYSKSLKQQTGGIQAIAKKDAELMKILKDRNLVDASGNVSTKKQDEQALEQAYLERKLQVGADASYEKLMENKQFKDILDSLGQDNSQNRQKAFKLFMAKLGEKDGLGAKEIEDANTAVNNAKKTGQVTDQLKNNQATLLSMFKNGMENAQNEDQKKVLEAGKHAIQVLNSGKPIDEQRKKELLAELSEATAMAGLLSANVDAETRALMQNIQAQIGVKNAAVKSIQIISGVAQNQKDMYLKAIGAITSLQNAITKSADVKRSQLKSGLQKSKSALVQFGGGNVGANLSSVYKSQIGVSQSKIGFLKKAQAQLGEFEEQMHSMLQNNGKEFSDKVDQAFSGKQRDFGAKEIDVQGGKKKFSDALKEFSIFAKEGAMAEDDEGQEAARKKISKRQEELIAAIKADTKATNQQKTQRQNMVRSSAQVARQMVGTNGTIQGVKLKLQADMNNALAQQITALKNFGSSLKNASNSLVSLQASARKSQMATRQKLLRKNLGSNADSLQILQQQSQAVQQQYQQKKRMQQSKINATGQALAQAQAKYNADPSKANEEQLRKAKFAHSSAKQGLDLINLQQYQNANQAVASAMQLVSTKAQLAQQSLSIMQDAAQNVAGTTAQWYKLQNEKLSVMAQQVQGIRNVIKSKAFEKLSAQQQARYKNELAKKQLALAKQRIGAQRTVFEKQLGAIVGGLQAQGAFQGFNNAAVFGIGHGVNQAGMAVQRQNAQGGGYGVKTFGRQSRTQYKNQGSTSLQQAGDNAVKLGTPEASNLTKTKNADGSYSYMDQGTGKMVQVGSTVKKDSQGNAIFKRDKNGKLVINDKGQLVAQTDTQAQAKAKKQAQAKARSQQAMQSTRPDALPQDNQTQIQQQEKKEKQKKKDLAKSDHQIYVDILENVKMILSTLQEGLAITSSKDKGVKTGTTTPTAYNQNGNTQGQQGQGGQQQSGADKTKDQSKASGTTATTAASDKQQNSSGNSATAQSQATDYRQDQQQQLNSLVSLRNNNQDFSQLSSEQQQKINNRIAQLQAKSASSSSNGGVASSDKTTASAGSSSVDTGQVAQQSKTKTQTATNLTENPFFKVTYQQDALQGENNYLSSKIAENQKKVADNKAKIQRTKTYSKDDNALRQENVFTDQSSRLDKLKEKQLKDKGWRESGFSQKYAKNFLDTSLEERRNIVEGYGRQLRAAEKTGVAFGNDGDKKKYDLLRKKMAFLNKINAQEYYLREDFAKENKDFAFKHIEQLSKENAVTNLDTKQSSQLLSGNKKRIEQLKQQSRKHFDILTGNNLNATVQEKQKAIDYWNQNGVKTPDSQKTIDEFVRQSVRRGQKLNFDDKAAMKKRLGYQYTAKQRQKQLMGGTEYQYAKNTTQYASMLEQAKKYYANTYDLTKLNPQQQFKLVQQYVDKQKVQKQFDAKLQGQRAIGSQKETRQNKVAAHQMTTMTKQSLGIKKHKKVLGDKQLKSILEKKGIDTSELSDYDLQNQRAKILLQKKQKSAQKKLAKSTAKFAKNPHSKKAKEQFQKAKASVEQAEKEKNQFQKNAQLGRQIAVQQTTDANEKKLAKNAKKQQNSLMKDKKLADIHESIQKVSKFSYQDIKTDMLKKGLTQEQFQKFYGKKGEQTQQQLRNMQKYKSDFKREQLSGVAEQLARKEFNKSRDDKARKAAFQGNLVRQKTWQGLSQREKQALTQKQMSKAQRLTERAHRRQSQRQQNQQIIKQNEDLVKLEKEKLLDRTVQNDETNYDKTRKQAVQYYKRKGIDLNGANEQQQDKLIQQFAQKRAQQTVVNNEKKKIQDTARQMFVKETGLPQQKFEERRDEFYNRAKEGIAVQTSEKEQIKHQQQAVEPAFVQQVPTTIQPQQKKGQTTTYSAQAKADTVASASVSSATQSNQRKQPSVTPAQPQQNSGIKSITSTNNETGGGFVYDKNIQTGVSPYGLPAISGDGKLRLEGLQKMFHDMVAALMNSADKQSQTHSNFC